jgi:hypothetical protein
MGVLCSPIQVFFPADEAGLLLDLEPGGLYVEIQGAGPDDTIRGDLLCFEPFEEPEFK